MLGHVEKLFDDMQKMLKKLKKSTYEENMKLFREKNEAFFPELLDYLEQAENRQQAAQDLGVCFVDRVEEHFSVKGKIKGSTQVDLNFFMIYYTFPAILLTNHPDADLVAAEICKEWGNRFIDSKIGYAEYDKILGAFKEKRSIFGIS